MPPEPSAGAETSPSTDPELAIAPLLERVRAHGGDADVERLRSAFLWAVACHGEQKRDSGVPYWTHPLAVAEILAALYLDVDSLITALLHDVVEDTPHTLQDVETRFGGEVARLVNGVTKLSRLEVKAGQNAAAENFRKLVLATSDDVRVLLVKLADRLHNMQTLSGIQSPERRLRLAHETMDVYAPLAERIGLDRLRSELEELAFAESQPEAAAFLRTRLASLRETGKQSRQEIISAFKGELQAVGIEAEISGRVKGSYSIWRKMKRRAVAFEQLTDIMAFRIVVEDIGACYAALGTLHARYPLIPGRFKDYVSIPKPNGYRALHTAVIGPGGYRTEIQIRDRDMHRVAELGVAAHWYYKDARARASRGDAPEYAGKKMEWMRDLLEILEHAQSPEEFLEHTRMEVYQDKVFCFTPTGELISLPRGANAIDFAYAVHSEVGHRCTGARIGGRLVPLRTTLNNGEQVEILQGKRANPSPDWESLVETPRARSAIRRFVRREKRDQFVRLGKTMLEEVLRREGHSFNEATLAATLDHWSLESLEDLFARVGENLISRHEVINQAYPQARVKPALVAGVQLRTPGHGRGKEQKPGAEKTLAIRGLMPGMAIHFARCCHPIPGDRIVGIVITGRGITVHTMECDNLSIYRDAPERWLDIDWEDTPKDTSNSLSNSLSSRLNVTILNRPGGLGSLCTVIGGGGSNILNLKIVHRSEDFFDLLVDVAVRDTEHLGAVMAALRGNADVCSVERSRN